MFTRILAAATASTLLIAGCGSPKSSQELAKPLCYIATVGDDQARFQFDSPLKVGKTSGVLEYQFAQKDQSWGIFTGTFADKTLSINYQFASEGVVSYRDISYSESANGDLSGEGFIFKPSKSCEFTKNPYLWQPLEVAGVEAGTFHDPETGYYAQLKFTFPTSKKDMKIRCIGAVKDSQGGEIARWINLGFLGTGNIHHWNIATNIKPDQVDLVSQGDVTCQYS